MSVASATAFLERSETDSQFAAEFEPLRGDRDAVLAKMRDIGYDATPDEILTAFTDRYGIELTADQLEAVAAGSELPLPWAIVSTGASVVAVTAVVAAVAIAAI
jgi:predicted ribosomally synthesized peptide with nif11-like leader